MEEALHKPSFIDTVRTVLAGAIGIRRRDDHERAPLNPVHLVVAAAALQLVAFFANHSPVPLAATLMGLCLVALLALRSIARLPAQSGPYSPPEVPEPTR